MDLEKPVRDPSRQVATTSLLANGFTALAATGGTFLTGSAALLALAVTAGATLASQWLLLARISRKRGRGGQVGWGEGRRSLAPRHPRGYQRERFFGGFALSMLLGAASSMFLLIEGLDRLRQPAPLEQTSLAVVIAVAAVVVTGGSLFRSTITAGTDLVASSRLTPSTDHQDGSRGQAAASTPDNGTASSSTADSRVTSPGGWWRYLIGTRRPALAAVLLEDTVSFACRLAAAVAVVLADQLGRPVLDTAGLLVIAGLTATAALLQAVLLKELVVGEGATGTDQQGIAAAIEIEPSVVRLVHMETYRRGPEELLVGAKVELVDGLDLAEVAEVTQRLEAGIHRAVPAARAVYLEPDVCRTGFGASGPDVNASLSKPDLLGRLFPLTWLRSLRTPSQDSDPNELGESDPVGQTPAAQ